MKKLFTLFAVAAMAYAAQAATLTVADGTDYQSDFPVYGYYADSEGTISQMIYPADMLTNLKDNKITGVKFYPDGNITFSCKLELSLMEVEAISYNYIDPELIDGATVVATIDVAKGDETLEFSFEGFEYHGGNLMVQTKVVEEGEYASTSTYFFGIRPNYDCSCNYYSWWWEVVYSDNFLPKATFTYEAADVPPTPPTPTGETAAPTFNGYTTDGIHAYFVQINPTEPSVIYYRVQYPDGTWSEWDEYIDILSFTGNGKYRVEAYAVAPDKLPSTEIAYEFVVSPYTGIEEMNADKTVAGVRYFNMAGQEMAEPSGLTIKVITYTDGTTSSVKVMK
jgi:hypothetical protein